MLAFLDVLISSGDENGLEPYSSGDNQLPRNPPDHSHADYKAGRYVVFDDRLRIPENLKSIEEGHIHIDERGVDIWGSGAYSGDGELAAVPKISPEGNDYILIRKATRADKDKYFNRSGRSKSPSQIRKRRETEAEILSQLERVENALAALAQLMPKHGGKGHNLPPEETIISPELYAATVQTVEDVRREVGSSNPFPVSIQRKASILKRAADSLKAFLNRVPGQFVDGAIKAAGSAAYSSSVTLAAPAAVLAATVAHEQISALLKALSHWLHLL